jgi:hypothetical protein
MTDEFPLPASARTVTRYHATGLLFSEHGTRLETQEPVVLYTEVAPLLTALAEMEQEIARLTALLAERPA